MCVWGGGVVVVVAVVVVVDVAFVFINKLSVIIIVLSDAIVLPRSYQATKRHLNNIKR